MRQTKKSTALKLLLESGQVKNKEEAKKLIMAGLVRVGNDHLVKKSSELYPVNTEFKIDSTKKYVSRAALKLQPALDKYLHSVKGKSALDIGASTGGFTDLLLQRGIDKVYAVDAGYGHLHYKLRTNPKVICLEKVNARYLSSTLVPEQIDVLTMDVSFISVTKLLPVVNVFLKNQSWAFILIKPQFEAPKSKVQSGGIVSSEETREQSVNKICDFVNKYLSWNIKDVIPAPILGNKGNKEYILIKN